MNTEQLKIIKEAIQDLRERIEAQYPVSDRQYPTPKRRYERDITIVHQAEWALETLEQPQANSVGGIGGEYGDKLRQGLENMRQSQQTTPVCVDTEKLELQLQSLINDKWLTTLKKSSNAKILAKEIIIFMRDICTKN